MPHTIASVSTPSGCGAISIVRLCGERSLEYALCFFNCSKLKGAAAEVRETIEPCKLYLGRFRYEEVNEQCFMVFFKAPKSYTGEDMVEFQLHGGVKLTQTVLNALYRIGAVPAEAGEFTKRAYLNGKVSLAGAEGILEIINAESQSALAAGYRLADGRAGAVTAEIGERILEVLSVFEASFDYPDEMSDEIQAGYSDILALRERVQRLVDSGNRGRMIREGVKIAILGRPNVGKSSLLNALLGEERAIVTAEAGTTRDTVSDSLEYDGVKLTFLDTAGIREGAGTVEAIGIERAFKAAQAADVVLYVIDDHTGETSEDEATLKALEKNGKKIIRIYNKADLTGRKDAHAVSALCGNNVESLLAELASEIKKGEVNGGDAVTEERHIFALNKALKYLNDAADNRGAADDVLAADLRSAYEAVSSIEGKDAPAEVVDRIFSRFCVGK